MYSIDEARVRAVGEALRRLGLDGVLELEEVGDPQLSALRRLAAAVGRGAAAAYALAVALVSYRLAMRGEDWWKCAADRLSSAPPSRPEDVVDNVIRFLEGCRGAALGRDQKIRRLEKLRARGLAILRELMEDPDAVTRDADGLLERLSKAMDEPAGRKTVTFAIKMAYYASRPPGSRVPLRHGVPLPVDVRVACVTASSGIASSVRDYREIVRSPRPAQEAWAAVSRLSGIPTPHIDSVLWLTGWAPRDLGQERAREAIRGLLARVTDGATAELVARELTYRPCPKSS